MLKIKIMKGGRLLTVEEIEIIVTAKIEEALNEFNKIVPAVKEKMKQIQDSFSKVNTQGMKNKLQQAVNFVKNKLQNFKESSEKSKIDLKVTNEDARKQITQLEKEIDSLQKKINARQMKLNVINPQIDKMIDDTKKSVTPKGINPNDKAMDATVNNALNNNKDFTTLSSQAQKLYAEIEMYNKQLDVAKSKMVELNRQTSQTANSQNKIVNAIGNVKSKIGQAKTETNSFKNSFNQMTKISQTVKSNIKNISSGIKNGLKHVLAYAGALFSLRGIYSLLSSSAQTWLSSQNAGAKQLSANIDYMKYAMGSALAPVIQFVTNLVYQLMKAIQSVAYALTGVNIFAKASASSYASMAGSAKKAKQETKALAGIHSEINNLQTSKNSDSGSGGGTSVAPNIDFSKVNKLPSSIIDAIKNGNWYEIGAMLGEKLNEAMDSIPWGKIQDEARKIGTNIAQLLNGFIATADWGKVGNTLAQGINTAIYLAYSFVSTFQWKDFGNAVSTAINSWFQNVKWDVIAQTLNIGIQGLLDSAIIAIENLDTTSIAKAIVDFVSNIDWWTIAGKVIELFLRALIEALIVLPVQLGMVLGEKLKEGIDRATEKIKEKTKESGGNVILGLLEGIAEIGDNIENWVYEHIFKPFIDGFKKAFGIHSPSTVMTEMGVYLIEGLKNGISGLWDRIKSPFLEFGSNVSNKFNEIKGNITSWANNTKTTVSNWGSSVKSKVSECWSNASSTVKNKVDTLKNSISTGLNTAKNSVSNWGSNIKTTFTDLGRNAGNWGKDLVSNMASGIKNNAHKVTNAVSSVAGKIKSFLHFTEPDEGPLSDFHTYMPDMIDLMVQGIKSNTNKVKNEIEDLTGMMSYTINTDRIIDVPQISSNVNTQEIKSRNSTYDSILNALSDMNSNDNNDRPIYLTVKVGDRVLGEILLDNLRNKKRQTGKDIEAIVGG